MDPDDDDPQNKTAGIDYVATFAAGVGPTPATSSGIEARRGRRDAASSCALSSLCPLGAVPGT